MKKRSLDSILAEARGRGVTDFIAGSWNYTSLFGDKITKKDLENFWNTIQDTFAGKMESIQNIQEFLSGNPLDSLISSFILSHIFKDYTPWNNGGVLVNEHDLTATYFVLIALPELKFLPYKFCNAALDIFDTFTLSLLDNDDLLGKLLEYFRLNKNQIELYSSKFSENIGLIDEELKEYRLRANKRFLPSHIELRYYLRMMCSYILQNSGKTKEEFLTFLKSKPDVFEFDGNKVDARSDEFSRFEDRLNKILLDGISREVGYTTHKSDKGQINPNIIVTDFDSLLSRYGNIKKMIYTNDRETVEYITLLGVDFKPYMNLTDHQVVYQALEILRSNPQLKGKALYQIVLEKVRDNHGLKLSDITKDDVMIYSDEIASYFEEAFSKVNGINGEFKTIKEHIESEMHSGNVSFRLASRDIDDLNLGDKCGDCTQKGGMNEEAPRGWLADVNTQFLKLYYDGKFMGRLNLVLVESDGKPLLIIDAIEFIPQAKEIKEYHLKAKTALEEGLKKVKEIAHKMGVREVGANAFSNSSNLGQVIEELGYTSEKDYDIKLVRRKKLNEVLGINDKITYFLQSAEFRNNDYITPIQLHYFEHFLNSEYLKDKKRREELNSLINRGRMDIASKKIAEYDETHHPDSELGKIFEAGEEILDDYSEDMIDGGEKEKQTETDSDAYDVLLMDVPESNLRETNKPQDAPYEKTEKKKKLHIDVRAMIARDALERLYSREPTRKESSTRLVKIM